jgi:hypothetical protein
MAMPAKGPRVALTVRLPYDEYREAVRRAKAREWTLTHYIGYCVARELAFGGKKRPSGGSAARSRGSWKPSEDLLMTVRDFGAPLTDDDIEEIAE